MLINLVHKVVNKRNLLNFLARHVHNESAQTGGTLHPLNSRKILKVSGDDVAGFLQGLITNDMRHFDESAKSIYSMFLNNKGRLLYETLVHKDQNESYLIECDSNVLSSIQRHLKIFKLRRKIAIDCVDDLKVWALTSVTDITVSAEKISLYKDPRLSDLGFRILAPTSISGNELGAIISDKTLVKDNEDDYKYLRYNLGVSEGVTDVPPGSCFPLEANCDYLHGVSFHKGCYVGQELTARVHHTGVVRKRLMPLKFNENINEHIDNDAVIFATNNPKANLGKLRGFIKDCGLGLVRIKESIEAESLTIGKYTATVVKPQWWPIEAPKEKLNTKYD